MSKPLSKALYDAFEKHGALKLRADLFLSVLRSVGVTMSPREEDTLINWLGKDLEDCVDVQKFCTRFDNDEQKARSAQHVTILLTTCGPKSTVEHSLTSNHEICAQSASAHGTPTHELRVTGMSSSCSSEGIHDVIHSDDGNVGRRAGLADVNDQCDRPALAFSRQVTADDNSVWSLGSEERDKCTLPSRRPSVEREKIVSSYLVGFSERSEGSLGSSARGSPVSIRGYHTARQHMCTRGH
eukprot:TRINITY_DN6646_c2_g1_i1.p1 TRINITY_DN6646_c2_g1~~TRINITY_DN6646_c2_g1_i1.p1  ORF type:complete len:241 (-),score=19.11 TRINITY_DN6646_c2_g1_i1:529-1251(-)